MHALPIEDHGVIGDLHTVALVGSDGCIDFMCFPHFDSPSIFASLLDAERGGRFQLAPTLADARPRQMYLPDTNVLLTRFLAHGGMGEITDYMPIEDGEARHDLVRRAKAIRGTVQFHLRCEPRFDYARAGHQIELRDDGHTAVFTSRGQDRMRLRLRAQVPLKIADGAAIADFSLDHGHAAGFVLEDARAGGDDDLPDLHDYLADSFKITVNFWRGWISRCKYQGRWREAVNRSALALKLLCSRPYGSIIAAPTFGLPENIGGERNWDYRYCWIRDASFTLYALMRLGFTDEASAFMTWLEQRFDEQEPSGRMQIMYGIDGRHRLDETTLPHLRGFRDSRPVRIGNGAHDQLQLDIYGELMDAVYLYDKYGETISLRFWKNITNTVEWLCNNWQQKDEGIWEVRGGRQHFLFSRLMCWVAVDRAIRLARNRSLPAPLSHWHDVRDSIRAEIMQHFWNPERQAFVQHRDTREMDAAALLMPLVRFIGPKDPQWLSTLRAIEQDLCDDSLVYRYRTEAAAPDGLTGEEGTFSMCSFWYAECLSRAGDLQQARLVFEKMLGYANHLGLFAEELGPRSEHLGNFPQAFSHVALISAAYDLDRRLREAGWRA